MRLIPDSHAVLWPMYLQFHYVIVGMFVCHCCSRACWKRGTLSYSLSYVPFDLGYSWQHHFILYKSSLLELLLELKTLWIFLRFNSLHMFFLASFLTLILLIRVQDSISYFSLRTLYTFMTVIVVSPVSINTFPMGEAGTTEPFVCSSLISLVFQST